MGRPYAGTATVYSSPRLELSKLTKAGFFTRNAEVRGTWNWSNGDVVEVTTTRNASEVSMVLSFTWTHPHTGIGEEIRQRFDLLSKPSNLGRGEVLYYPGQLCGKLDRSNTRYWDIDRHLDHMRGKKRAPSTYRGRPTKRARRLDKLLREQDHVDNLRWSLGAFPKRLQGVLMAEGYP